jgi:23S rRNA pseudouridine1911/1915/1917 synthase
MSHPRKKLHERIEVVFEDQDVIVVDKAAGILSYPVEGEREESAIQLIRRFWKVQNNRSAHLYLMHRLDKETSGLIVFTKTSHARDSLRRQFEEHSVVRGYLAITDGIPKQKYGKIQTFLGRNERGKRSVTRLGKSAITHYQVLSFNPEVRRSLVRCYLHTGRTHQVRIHLAHIGTSVVGDPVYGKGNKGRMALHAEVLGFLHPRNKQPLLLRTSLPEGMRELLGSRSNCVNLEPGSFR